MKFPIRRITKSILIVLIFSLVTSSSTIPIVAQTLQEQVDQLQQQLKDIQNQKQNIEGQINNNSNLMQGYNSQVNDLYIQVVTYQNDIDQLDNQIKQLDLNIQILNIQIEQAKTDIKNSEDAVINLQSESDQRIKASYMNYRMYGDTTGEPQNIFTTESVNDYYKDSQYKELIQSDTNRLMVKLSELKIKLAAQKKTLDAQVSQLKKDESDIVVKKNDLDDKKSTLEVKIASYSSAIQQLRSSIEYQESQVNDYNYQEMQTHALLAQKEEELFRSFNPVDEGEYVTAGKYIGAEGCTGLCTGHHLHFGVLLTGVGWLNPCNYLPNGSFYNSYWGMGCYGGDGSFALPMPSNAVMTQDMWYGHNAIDIQGSYGGPIYAAINGWVHKGFEACDAQDSYNYGVPCNNGGALFIKQCEVQNCSSGLQIYYLHLSSY